MTLTESFICWKDYLSYAERMFIAKGQVIYEEDADSAKGFYYLEKGLIKISVNPDMGQGRIIDIVSEMKLFGEQAVDGGVYFSTASAMIDSVVYFFPYGKINKLMKKDDGFRELYYENLTEKLKVLSNNLLYDSLPAEKIIAHAILLLNEKFASNIIPFTQQELSHYTNLNRVTIHNFFKKWNDSVVSLENKVITIKNISKLKVIATI